MTVKPKEECPLAAAEGGVWGLDLGAGAAP